MHVVERSIAAEAVTFVATKVTKKASVEMLLCAHGLYPANQAEPRVAIILHNFVGTSLSLQQKLAMPQQPHKSTKFSLLSPEAFLLTRRIVLDEKGSKGLCDSLPTGGCREGFLQSATSFFVVFAPVRLRSLLFAGVRTFKTRTPEQHLAYQLFK